MFVMFLFVCHGIMEDAENEKKNMKKTHKKKLNNLKLHVWHEFVVHVRERQLIINYIFFQLSIVAENLFLKSWFT